MLGPDLGLEDPHYRHLAQLLYDARFPVLTHLSLARNRFSSRFVRDWSKSFANYCFQRIEALDVSGATVYQLCPTAKTLCCRVLRGCARLLRP